MKTRYEKTKIQKTTHKNNRHSKTNKCHKLIKNQKYNFFLSSNKIVPVKLHIGACQHHLHGEDSFFTFNDRGFGVADGVGGWSKHPGASAAEFSQRVMNECSNLLSKNENISAKELSEVCFYFSKKKNDCAISQLFVLFFIFQFFNTKHFVLSHKNL